MQFQCDMNLWIKPERAAAFVADPSGCAGDIYFVPTGHDWPRHYNYILLGQQRIDMPLNTNLLQTEAVKELDSRIDELRASMTKKIAELTACRESLLALTYEVK